MKRPYLPTLIVVALFTTGIAAVWFGGLLVSDADFDHLDPDVSLLTDAQITDLQATATSACRCERSGGAEESCWSAYRQKTESYAKTSWGTACAPVSTEAECFITEAGEQCVVTGYSVNGASPEYRDVKVCDEAEAVAIEKAVSDPFYRDGKLISSDNQKAWDAANAQSDRNIDLVMKRIRNGEPFEAPDPARDGCV